MTKQEDIREAVAREVRVGNDEEGWYVALNKADDILKVEAELGAMIKTKCPHCEFSQFKEDEHVGMAPCPWCNSTGYIFEPLIKD